MPDSQKLELIQVPGSLRAPVTSMDSFANGSTISITPSHHSTVPFDSQAYVTDDHRPFKLILDSLLWLFGLFVAVLVGMTLASQPAHAKIKKQAPLAKPVLSRVSLILNINEALHAALVNRNDALIEAQIRALDVAVRGAIETLAKHDRDMARKIASQPQLHDRNLNNMLTDISKSLRQAQTSGGDKRRDHLRDSFRKVALMTKLYQISHPYKTYFCKIDRSVWLQRGNKPQNPILSDTSPNCGIQVK